jgi:hypothetical protein
MDDKGKPPSERSHLSGRQGQHGRRISKMELFFEGAEVPTFLAFFVGIISGLLEFMVRYSISMR